MKMQSAAILPLLAFLCTSDATAVHTLRRPKANLATMHVAPAPAAAASPGPAAPTVEVTKLEMTMNDVNYKNLTKTETGFHKMPSAYDDIEDAACDAVKQAVTVVAAAAPGPAGASPAPAVAASPAALLQQGPAAQGPAAVPAEGPAGGPASVIVNMPPPAAPKVDVNCALHPNGDGTTNFVAQITDPQQKNFLLAVDPTFNSTLEHSICAKIRHNTGIHAGCSEVKISTVQVKEWSSGICEKHLHTMVSRFTKAYTRAQVPVALYNACSIFMTAITFSHDSIINAADTKRCQVATLKFQKTWKYGKGTEGLDVICHDICEQKFGNHAPQCHVTRGNAFR